MIKNRRRVPSPFSFVAALLWALQLYSRAVFGHGGGLHAWDFGTSSHDQLPHKKLARCSTFSPYEADLATSSIAPLHRTSSLQLGVEGSIDVYIYLDKTCRMTSALLPSLKFWAAETSSFSIAGDPSGSGLAHQQQQQRPMSHMHTSAYGFRGACESGLVGVYTHHLMAGYNRNNLLHWRDAHTDEEGSLHGIAPSGANTHPRQPTAHVKSSEGAAHDAEQDPAALSTSALQSILLVPAEGPLFCCNLHWEDEHGEPSQSASPSEPFAAARDACVAASPSLLSSSSSSPSSSLSAAAGTESGTAEAEFYGSGSTDAGGIMPHDGGSLLREGEQQGLLQEHSQGHIWQGGVSADQKQTQMQSVGELHQGLQLPTQEHSQGHMWHGGVSAVSEQTQTQPAGELQQGLQLPTQEQSQGPIWQGGESANPQQMYTQPAGELQQGLHLPRQEDSDGQHRQGGVNANLEQTQTQSVGELQQGLQMPTQEQSQGHFWQGGSGANQELAEELQQGMQLPTQEQPQEQQFPDLQQQQQEQQEQLVEQPQQQEQHVEQEQQELPVEQQQQQRRRLMDNGLVSPTQTAAPPAPATCPDMPAAPECATYEYPADRVQQDLDALCSAMPDMPGCSVRNACQAHKLTDERVCNGMVLLATLCEDMPGMSGCRTYNTMCGEGSVIQECKAHPPISRTPSWSESRQAMFDMCADHPMQQCASCTKSHCPDPLTSLSGACTDMPDMPECALFDRWCQANEGRLAYFCGEEGGGSSSGLPSMLMYFHRRVSETVLWRSWVPKTYVEYAGTMIVVILFGITSIGVKTCVTMLSMWWKVQASYEHMPLNSYPSSTPDSPSFAAAPSLLLCWLPRGHQWWQNAIKATISAVSITLDYWNMLIAMTFNVGLFCAVIVGYMLGAFIFASVPDNFAAYLQVITPPNVFVDCECPKPTAYCNPTYSGTEDGEEGSRDDEPLNPKPAQKAKPSSKAALAAQQGGNAALLTCRGGDIEASPRIIHCGGGLDTYTTPSCCPGLD